MIPPAHQPTPWLITAQSANADKVFFAHDESDGLSTWIPMVRSSPTSGQWTLRVSTAPQPGHYRHYTVEGQSVINGGDAGLIITRASSPPSTLAHQPATA
ncbi:MAG: hypothetical protein V3V20_09285 [Algisphaera sp.]